MCLTNNLLIFLSLSLMFNLGIDTQTTGPDFCGETKLDSAFSDHTLQIRLIKQNWIWTYIETEKRMSAPLKQIGQKYKLQSILYISALPPCAESGRNCMNFENAKDLLIMFYKTTTKPFAGAYQAKRVVNGVVTRLTEESDLPFGLRAKGNIFSMRENFWPKHLKAFYSFDRKRTILVYNPYKYEIIMVSNGRKNGWLCFNAFLGTRDWRDGWKCVSVLNDWQFIGAFVRKNNVFVLASKGNDNRLFIINKDHELIDTYINVQKYFDCNPVQNSAALAPLVKDESESSGSGISGWVWLIICVVIVVIIFTIIAIIIFYAIRGIDETESPKTKAPKRKPKPKPTPKPVVVAIDKKEKEKKEIQGKMLDNKGKEVGKDKIGVLDSEVNWDIVVQEPSRAPAPHDNPESTIDTPGVNKKKSQSLYLK